MRLNKSRSKFTEMKCLTAIYFVNWESIMVIYCFGIINELR